MKKKIICMLLVLVMCLSFIVSCGRDDSSSDTGNGGDTVGGNGGSTDDGKKPTGGGSGGGEEDDDDDEWWLDITYEPTTLRFQMTDCSNLQELPSGCARYLAGEKPENKDVDKYVADRNDAALVDTNIKSVTYEYYPDDQTYGFSQTIDIMYEAVMNPDSKTPDMFCNWMTDMLCASLKGAFANLNSRVRGQEDQYGKNYFDLKDPGYMADLMGSLTLSQEKIYVIASDYFMDLIRAFFVVPVNVNLYNSIAEDMIDDLNDDGAQDINDFFEEVLAGDWTYERLIAYAQKIYLDTNKTVDGEDPEDQLGFALPMNGLPAAGLVYTSSVVVIQKTPTDDGGFNYAYPDENEDLFNLFNAVNNLMNQTGIICVDDKGTDLSVNLRVRTMFSTNKLLFGGIILVGALEYESYQEMKSVDDGGFGVVPVPVYRKGDSYLTQIHVVGRAGGIAHSTTKYAQCTAFLHYQSSHSAEVLNEYYDYQLTYDIADNLDGNVTMLQYIRQNVRTSFDKLFEDAIGFFYESSDPEAVNNRWHTMLCNDKYQITNMRDRYTKIVPTKKESLKELIAQYNTLPD